MTTGGSWRTGTPGDLAPAKPSPRQRSWRHGEAARPDPYFRGKGLLALTRLQYQNSGLGTYSRVTSLSRTIRVPCEDRDGSHQQRPSGRGRDGKAQTAFPVPKLEQFTKGELIHQQTSVAVLSHRLGAVWQSKLREREWEKVAPVFGLDSCGWGAVLGQVRPSPLLQSSGRALADEPRKCPARLRSRHPQKQTLPSAAQRPRALAVVFSYRANSDSWEQGEGW